MSRSQIWGPIFENSYDKLTKNLSKSWNLGRACDFQEKLMNLCKTYDDITAILWKRKIRGKWCHSGNPLTEAVIGRILWAKNNWQPEWRFAKNAFEKWLILLPFPSGWTTSSAEAVHKTTYHFLKKILGSCILLTYKRLMKILRSFENRARVLLFSDTIFESYVHHVAANKLVNIRIMLKSSVVFTTCTTASGTLQLAKMSDLKIFL